MNKLIILCFLLSAAACSKEKIIQAPSDGQKKEDNFFLVGDPVQYVFGTKLQNYISDINVLKNQKLYLVSSTVYKERAEIPKADEELKAEKPSKDDANLKMFKEEDLMAFELDKEEGGVKYYKFWLKRSEEPLYWIFEELPDGGARLVSYRYKTFIFEVNQALVHLSVSQDGSEISIWAYENQNPKNNKFALDYRFSTGKPAPDKLQLNQTYNYMLGPNRVTKWDATRPLVLKVCGKDALEHAEVIEEAFIHWKTALTGRLDLQLEYEPDNCPPYSDLNTHGLYFIDGLKRSYENANYGVARLALGTTIIDGDIMIFKHELLKMTDNYTYQDYKEQLRRTLTHEIGHWLGLDHIFDGTQSVMSYTQKDRDQLHDYDLGAIHVLYPLQE